MFVISYCTYKVCETSEGGPLGGKVSDLWNARLTLIVCACSSARLGANMTIGVLTTFCHTRLNKNILMRHNNASTIS